MAKRKKSLKSTIWGGRFEGESSDNLIKFNSSISFDKNLILLDNVVSLFYFIYKIIKKIIKLR